MVMHSMHFILIFISQTFCFSYGILLWSVVTGKQPYHSESPILQNHFYSIHITILNTLLSLSLCPPVMPNLSSLVRFRVREGDRPDLMSIDSSLANGLEDLIDLMTRCWDSDPKSRPIFMGELYAIV